MKPTPAQLAYHEEQVAKYRQGGFRHSSGVIAHTFGMGSYNIAPVDPPVVCMGQDEDPFYCQYFNSRDEVEAFIAELRAAADEAWGVPQPCADKAALSNDRFRIDPVTGNVGIGSKA